jgi:hypothetical protein
MISNALRLGDMTLAEIFKLQNHAQLFLPFAFTKVFNVRQTVCLSMGNNAKLINNKKHLISLAKDTLMSDLKNAHV